MIVGCILKMNEYIRSLCAPECTEIASAHVICPTVWVFPLKYRYKHKLSENVIYMILVA